VKFTEQEREGKNKKKNKIITDRVVKLEK